MTLPQGTQNTANNFKWLIPSVILSFLYGCAPPSNSPAAHVVHPDSIYVSDINPAYFWLDTTAASQPDILELYHNALTQIGRPFDAGHFAELRVFFHIHFSPQDFLYVFRWKNNKNEVLVSKITLDKYHPHGRRLCVVERLTDSLLINKNTLLKYISLQPYHHQQKVLLFKDALRQTYFDALDNHLVIECNTPKKDFLVLHSYCPANFKQETFLFENILRHIPYTLPPHSDILDAFPSLNTQIAPHYQWECDNQ